MKRLLIATDSFLPKVDGVARFLSEIIPRLNNRYYITVLAPHYKGRQAVFKNTKIIQFPLKKKAWGDFTPSKVDKERVERYVKESDLVFAQSIFHIGASAICCAKRYKKPVAAYMHAIEWKLASEAIAPPKIIKFFINIIVRAIAWDLYNKCNLLIVPSNDVAEALKKNWIRTKTKLIRLGTNIRIFRPVKDIAQAKKSLDINPEYPVIGLVSRISREKDILTLYRAFKIIERKYQKVILLIVGKGVEDYQALFELNRNIRTESAGLKDVVKYLQAMDIFVLPSLVETTSLALMEAMACGLPVVSTNVGFAKHAIKNGYNGVLFPKRNYQKLARKLEILLNNSELRKKLGQSARKTVLNYSWEATAKEIADALDKLG